VTDYVVTLLDGQVYGGFQAVRAMAELPAVAQAGVAPGVYVWPSEGEEERYAAPRGTGLKRVTHRVTIYALVMMMPTGTLSFRDLIQGIVGTLRSTTMPVSVTDAVTGETSDIVLIGERMRYEVYPPEALKTQRLQGYSGVIDAEIVEMVKA
jgi:hypothetical protein